MNIFNVDFFEEYQYNQEDEDQLNSLVSLESETNDNDG